MTTLDQRNKMDNSMNFCKSLTLKVNCGYCLIGMLVLMDRTFYLFTNINNKKRIKSMKQVQLFNMFLLSILRAGSENPFVLVNVCA